MKLLNILQFWQYFASYYLLFFIMISHFKSYLLTNGHLTIEFRLKSSKIIYDQRGWLTIFQIRKNPGSGSESSPSAWSSWIAARTGSFFIALLGIHRSRCPPARHLTDFTRLNFQCGTSKSSNRGASTALVKNTELVTVRSCLIATRAYVYQQIAASSTSWSHRTWVNYGGRRDYALRGLPYHALCAIW